MEDKVRANLAAEFPNGEISVVVEGNRALVRVVTDDFDGLNQLKRQQRVYGCLNQLIVSGELHALTIQAKTPGEVREE